MADIKRILINENDTNVIVREGDIIHDNETFDEKFINRGDGIIDKINALNNQVNEFKREIIRMEILSDSLYDLEQDTEPTELLGKPILHLVDGFLSITTAEEGLLRRTNFNNNVYVTHSTRTTICPVRIEPLASYTWTKTGNSDKYPNVIWLDKDGIITESKSWTKETTITAPENAMYLILDCDWATSFTITLL